MNGQRASWDAILLLGGVMLTAGFAAAAVRAADSFPVAIRVDAAQPLGPLRPIWRFFGADEPNYATMKNGKKLLGGARRSSRRSRSIFARTTCSRPATGRRRSSGARPVPIARTPAGKPSTIGRFSTASSTRTSSAACGPTCRSASCRSDLSTQPEPYQHHWKSTDPYDEIFTGWALSAEGLREVVRAGLPMDEALRRALRRGGSGHLVLGNLERSEHRLLAGDARGIPQAARLRDRRRATGAADRPRRRPRHGRQRRRSSRATFSSTASAARTTPPARSARRSISFPSTPRVRRGSSIDGHVRMGIAEQLRTIDDGFRIVASFPELKENADRHRRVGPRRLRRLPRSAARLPQRHDVFQLHGRELRPQARPGRPARRESRRGAHLGVRVRGPAVLRRLPLAGHQRDRQAGAQRVSHVRQDERPAAGGRERCGHVARRDASRRRPREAGRLRAWPACDGDKLCVLLWHYHDDDLPGPTADVELTFANLPLPTGTATVEQFRIDADHSNAYTAWQRLGSQQAPTPQQYAELEDDGRLAEMEQVAPVEIRNRQATVRMSLPRQAVALLVISCHER